jgi:hypothetical protein
MAELNADFFERTGLWISLHGLLKWPIAPYVVRILLVLCDAIFNRNRPNKLMLYFLSISHGPVDINLIMYSGQWIFLTTSHSSSSSSSSKRTKRDISRLTCGGFM